MRCSAIYLCMGLPRATAILGQSTGLDMGKPQAQAALDGDTVRVCPMPKVPHLLIKSEQIATPVAVASPACSAVRSFVPMPPFPRT